MQTGNKDSLNKKNTELYEQTAELYQNIKEKINATAFQIIP